MVNPSMVNDLRLKCRNKSTNKSSSLFINASMMVCLTIFFLICETVFVYNNIHLFFIIMYKLLLVGSSLFSEDLIFFIFTKYESCH